MIKIENLKIYFSTIPDGEKVCDFLLAIDENTPKGRHDFNENLYVNVVYYETKNADCFDGIFESHKDFVDLHVLIDGEEKIFYGDKSDMVVTKEYDKSGDYELLKGKKYTFVEYGKLQGVELPVNEPHMAGYLSGKRQKILKAIVKIRDNR